MSKALFATNRLIETTWIKLLQKINIRLIPFTIWKDGDSIAFEITPRKINLLETYESEPKKKSISPGQHAENDVGHTRTSKLPSPLPATLRHKLLNRFPKPKENLYHSLKFDRLRSRSHSNSTQVQCAHFASSNKEKRNRARAKPNRNHVSLHWIQTNLRQR